MTQGNFIPIYIGCANEIQLAIMVKTAYNKKVKESLMMSEVFHNEIAERLY